MTLHNLGDALASRGELAAAVTRYQASLALSRQAAALVNKKSAAR